MKREGAKKGKKEGAMPSIPVRSTSESRHNSGFHHFTQKSRALSRALLEEFNKCLEPVLLPYKPAKLYSAKGDLTKEWYVEYYFRVPGEALDYLRIKERFDINRIKTLKDRLAYGRQLVEFLNEKLKNGFNPFEAVKVVKGSVEIKILAQLFAIKTELCLTGSDYSKNTFQEHYNRLSKYIRERKLEGLTIYEFDLEQVKRYKKWMLANEYAKKTINASFSYLTQFWILAVDKKWTDENPFKAVPRVTQREETRVKQVERFEPLTSEELETIFGYLKKTGQRDFIAYLSMIYYGWVRPIEITRLKISDLNFDRDAIRFRSTETKNKTSAYVQMVPPLKKILEGLHLENYPADSYIFSKEEFKPGPAKMHKYYALDRWRRIVKEKLKIDKDMYALKHTGNIEYLINNKGKTDLKWQQMQNRHKTASQTDTYNRKLGLYFIEVGNLNFRVFE